MKGIALSNDDYIVYLNESINETDNTNKAYAYAIGKSFKIKLSLPGYLEKIGPLSLSLSLALSLTLSSPPSDLVTAYTKC